MIQQSGQEESIVGAAVTTIIDRDVQGDIIRFGPSLL